MTAARPPVDYIQRTREQYDSLGYPPYRWVENTAPAPFVPLAKPISESKLALIASGGIYQSGQIAFHYKDDFSYRVITTDHEIEIAKSVDVRIHLEELAFFLQLSPEGTTRYKLSALSPYRRVSNRARTPCAGGGSRADPCSMTTSAAAANRRPVAVSRSSN